MVYAKLNNAGILKMRSFADELRRGINRSLQETAMLYFEAKQSNRLVCENCGETEGFKIIPDAKAIKCNSCNAITSMAERKELNSLQNKN